MASNNHHPIQGASWMLTAGLAFALVNSLAQVASIKFGLTSTTVAFVQYSIALVVILPYLFEPGHTRVLANQSSRLAYISCFSFRHWYPTLAMGFGLSGTYLARYRSAHDISAVCNDRLRPVSQRTSRGSEMGRNIIWLYRCYVNLRTLG